MSMDTKMAFANDFSQVSQPSSDIEVGDQGSSPTTGATSTLSEHEIPRDSCNDVFTHISLESQVAALFGQKILTKIYRTATKYLPPGAVLGTDLRRNSDCFREFPEYVPQIGPDAGKYVLRDAEFWTCGFFPGTLYALLERIVRFPRTTHDCGMQSNASPRVDSVSLHRHFKLLCETWADPLHHMSCRTDTHDIGFIVMPALRRDWELTGNSRSLQSISQAARSLASRYIPTARAIRSWDVLKKKDIEILDMDKNLICIIDSMCNLDLLYYAAEHSQDDRGLADIATTHARTILHSHLRQEKPTPLDESAYNGQWYSTYHVAVIDPNTGAILRQMTSQGYSDDSTWTRGQAWGILGYAQVYMATKQDDFLYAACGLVEYFLYRLKTSPDCVEVQNSETGHGNSTKGRYVPLFDFDAPIENPKEPVRDSSAGVIAANGMLILSQALASRKQDVLAARYREAAVRIVQDTLDFALAPESAHLVRNDQGGVSLADPSPGKSFEAILKYGTANNNKNARKRYANHGLVYGDYYLVEFGNRLLNMGLV